jgi:hypothetical protein
MSTIPATVVIQALIDLLTEAYAGPPDPRSTWFIDNEPNAGLIGLLRNVTARQASTSVDGSGRHGTTIASHVEHLRWSLHNANNTFRGQAWNPNWSQSWELDTADEVAWDGLRLNLQREFEGIQEVLRQQTDLQGEYLLGVMALIPHAAFHLGVLRQMVERVTK